MSSGLCIECGHSTAPCYARQLDTCADAEEKIPELDLAYEYAQALKIVLGYEADEGGYHCEFACITATARQRCEAMYAIRDDLP